MTAFKELLLLWCCEEGGRGEAAVFSSSMRKAALCSLVCGLTSYRAALVCVSGG